MSEHPPRPKPAPAEAAPANEPVQVEKGTAAENKDQLREVIEMFRHAERAGLAARPLMSPLDNLRRGREKTAKAEAPAKPSSSVEDQLKSAMTEHYGEVRSIESLYNEGEAPEENEKKKDAAQSPVSTVGSTAAGSTKGVKGAPVGSPVITLQEAPQDLDQTSPATAEKKKVAQPQPATHTGGTYDSSHWTGIGYKRPKPQVGAPTAEGVPPGVPTTIGMPKNPVYELPNYAGRNPLVEVPRAIGKGVAKLFKRNSRARKVLLGGTLASMVGQDIVNDARGSTQPPSPQNRERAVSSEQKTHDDIVKEAYLKIYPDAKELPSAKKMEKAINAWAMNPGSLTAEERKEMVQKFGTSTLHMAEAMKIVESAGKYDAIGPDGEGGAYQWGKGEFARMAQEAGLDPTDHSARNQDLVAIHKVHKLFGAGYTPEQIPAFWNAGPGSIPHDAWKNRIGINAEGTPYNTPQHVAKVMKHYTRLEAGEAAVAPPLKEASGVIRVSATTDTAPSTPEQESSSSEKFAREVSQLLDKNTTLTLAELAREFSPDSARADQRATEIADALGVPVTTPIAEFPGGIGTLSQKMEESGWAVRSKARTPKRVNVQPDIKVERAKKAPIAFVEPMKAGIGVAAEIPKAAPFEPPVPKMKPARNAKQKIAKEPVERVEAAPVEAGPTVPIAKVEVAPLQPVHERVEPEARVFEDPEQVHELVLGEPSPVGASEPLMRERLNFSEVGAGEREGGLYYEKLARESKRAEGQSESAPSLKTVAPERLYGASPETKRNRHGIEVDPTAPRLFTIKKEGKDQVVVYGGSIEKRSALAQKYLQTHPQEAVLIEMVRQAPGREKPEPYVFEYKINGDGSQQFMPINEPSPDMRLFGLLKRRIGELFTGKPKINPQEFVGEIDL